MPLISWQVAENILGEYVIVPDNLGNFSYPSSFLNAECALGADELRRLREGGFLLFPGPPEAYSIVDMLRKWPEFFYRPEEKYPAELWYQGKKYGQEFARRSLSSCGWCAVSPEPVKGSENCEWKRQLLMLNPKYGESVPDAVLIVWMILLFSMVRKRRFFENAWVRTSAQVSIFPFPEGSPPVLGPQVYVGTEQGSIVLGFHRQGQTTPSQRRKTPVGVAVSLEI